MNLVFENDLLNLNPYGRRFFLILQEVVYFLILGSSFVFTGSSSEKLKYLGFLIIFFFLGDFLRKRFFFSDDLRAFLDVDKEKINIEKYLNPKVRDFLIDTITDGEILNFYHPQVFLLKRLLREKAIKNLLKELNIDYQVFSQETLFHQKSRIETIRDKNFFLNAYLPILKEAFNLGKLLSYPYINFLFLFYGLRIKAEPNLEALFEKYDLKKEYILSAVVLNIFSKKLSHNSKDFNVIFTSIKKPNKKRLLPGFIFNKVEKTFAHYVQDFTFLSHKKNIGFLVGHRQEVENIFLNLRKKRNFFLIGNENLERDAIMWHISWLIQNELSPKELFDFRLIKIDLNLIYTKERDKFSQVFSRLIEDIFDLDKIILYLSASDKNVVNQGLSILASFLEKKKNNKSIILVFSLDFQDYKNILSSFDHFFDKIYVKSLSFDDFVISLSLKSIFWTQSKKINLTPQSIVDSIFFSQDILGDMSLAEKVIVKAIETTKKVNGQYLTTEMIREIVNECLSDSIREKINKEKEKIFNLENLLRQRIVNQEYALKKISDYFARIFQNQDFQREKPLGIFLFLGPKGVGKTETAKTLTKIFYGKEQEMISLNMGNLQKKKTTNLRSLYFRNFIVVEEIIEAVKQKPRSLILLKDFEKTNPIFWNFFSQIFSKGFIEDSLGQKIDFKDNLIICTSSIFEEWIKEKMNQKIEFDIIVEDLKKKLIDVFSQDLLSQFDEVVVYRALKEEELLKITEMTIDDFKNDFLLKYGLILEIEEQVIKSIFLKNYDLSPDSVWLKEKLNSTIKSKIKNLISSGLVKRGQKIKIYCENNYDQIEVKIEESNFKSYEN